MSHQVSETDHTPKLLAELLESVDRPGSYCVGDTIHVLMPKISVDGVGELSFPVSKSQIDALIGVAERAPYGKGTDTLIDTSVRDCWQIDASHLRMTGGAWPKSLKNILDLVREGLGLENREIDAELYKLLIYEKGGFFAPHKDTEKVHRMIATLTLSLPTSGAGGELLVRHEDQETLFAMNANEPSEISYAAFYADCLHEVRPVNQGHRISLVFNLFIPSGQKLVGAPVYTTVTQKITSCLLNWKKIGKSEKLVWLLEHLYTEDGLSFDTLKGIDEVVARILGEAADHANFQISAAVLHVHDYGEPEYDGGYWEEPSIYSEMGEHFDRDQHLENWVARDGSHPPFGQLSLDDSELLQPEQIEHADPDEALIEDYTGNAGPLLQQIYRLAALVVWPKEMTLKIVAKNNINQAVSWVKTQRKHVKKEEMYLLVSQLIDVWPEARNQCSTYHLPEMLGLLGKTGYVDLLKKFLDQLFASFYDGQGSKPLAEVILLIDPKYAEEFLIKIVKQFMPLYPKDILSLMKILLHKKSVQSESKRYDTLRKVMCLATENLPLALKHSTELLKKEQMTLRIDGYDSYRNQSKYHRKHHLDSLDICTLFKLLLSLNLPKESIQVIDIFKDFPVAVTPGRMLPKVFKDLNKLKKFRDTKTLLILWQQSVDFLLQRSSTPPKEPMDWIIDGDEIPDTHDHFRELRAFCQNPVVQIQRLSYKEELRRHLKETIKALRLDIDYETERKGRPYSLVCTKNRNSFERRGKEYLEDKRYIKSLLSLAPSGDHVDAERVKQLEVALAA